MKNKHSRMNFPLQKRHLLGSVIAVGLIIFLFRFGGHHYCSLMSGKRKIEYVCIEDPESKNKTGLEDVKHLLGLDTGVAEGSGIQYERNIDLIQAEINRYDICVKNFHSDLEKGQSDFWSGDTQYVRRTHHSYLGRGKSIIIEVGGNVGEDAEAYLNMYQPKHFVVLEPLKLLYRRLGERLKNFTNAVVYNVGLGAKYETIMLKMEGNEGDATSPFFGSGKGTCSLKVVNAIDFFQKLGVGSFKVDLMTINCEGCEYDLLETIVSSNLIHHFKHIQFATHAKLKYLRQPAERYCKLQEILGRTHRLTYQYRYTWETWKLKTMRK